MEGGALFHQSASFHYFHLAITELRVYLSAKTFLYGTQSGCSLLLNIARMFPPTVSSLFRRLLFDFSDPESGVEFLRTRSL